MKQLIECVPNISEGRDVEKIRIISQIGDLLISFLKRKAKIKDTGKFLPGHGGLLDRVDGILFAIPIGLIIISL